MNRTPKYWFIAAASLVILGLATVVCVLQIYSWDLSKLSTQDFVINTYEIKEDFTNLSVFTDTADIRFVLADDGKCRVECYEEKNAHHAVTVSEDTLVIKYTDEKNWYQHIGIVFESPQIRIYLPKAEYTSLSISGSTGDVEIPGGFRFESLEITLSTGDITCSAASAFMRIKATTGRISVKNTALDSLDLSASTGAITVSDVVCAGDTTVRVSTGKCTLNNLKCRNLTSTADTGDLFLTAVTAAEKITIKSSTGDVRFEASDAAEIIVKTNTGDVKGSLLSGKIFAAHTDTGSIHIPQTSSGGICEITTNTGDIEITVD